MSEPTIWVHARGQLVIDRPIVVGILNVTPDSFSDGGIFMSIEKAVNRGCEMAAAGADIIDIGGESTRPQGAQAVDADEEIRRVVPVIERLVRALPALPISVDTTKAAVASRALDAGAAIVNDVSGFRLDSTMGAACAARSAGVILMHSRGGISDMATYAHAAYESVLDAVATELNDRVREALAAGVGRGSIVLDPGLGFSKRSEHSIQMIAGLSRLTTLGFPVLVGASRKRFVGELTGETIPSNRIFGTIAVNVAALDRGARLFRVHDVRANRQALDAAWAVISAPTA